uniref:Uncharacterized protein n=1 Tax=Panagrolaimus davidi TaxID=227884 RepID=A0A914P3K7_9BILA
MKLTAVVLLGLIGVAIALHGTGAYGNNGGYGNGGYGNNGGGNKHHISSESSSSESEEFIPLSGGYGNAGGRPGKDSSSNSEEDNLKKCKLICTSNAVTPVFLDRVPTAKACNSGDPDKITSDVLKCPTCCEGWGLQRGISKDSIVSHIIGDTPAHFKCVCCQRKCK